MAMDLYNYNEEACNSAFKMFNIRGKTAVIHLTGTGKSFIGFKLCENFCEAIEYSFSTENAEPSEKFNMVWNPLDDIWGNEFSQAAHYVVTSDINAVKPPCCPSDRYKLGEWLMSQKRHYPKGKLSAERQARLKNNRLNCDFDGVM